MDIINEYIEKTYLNNLLKYTQKNNIDASEINKKLSENISIQTEVLTETEIDTEVNYSDDYIFKKKWNKLNNIHKKIKVKQFINKLKITDSNKKELIDSLILLIDKKNLTKKNSVNYDSLNGRIISIPNLKCTNDKYIVDMSI